MCIALESRRLTFSRDGHRLAALATDDVTLVDLRSSATVRIAAPGAFATVAFVDQLWIVRAGDTGPKLARHDLAGARIDEIVLPIGDALAAAPVGDPAIVWRSTPAVAVSASDVGLHTSTLGVCDLAIPLTARRFVTATGARIVAPSGLSCELEPGTRAVGGAVVLDGTAAAIVVERGSARELVLIGLANGRLMFRRALPSTQLRVAARRGWLAVATAQRLAMIDLRSGNIVGELALPAGVDDFAIDPDARWLAVQQRDRAIELVELADVFGARTKQAAPPAVEVPSEPQVRAEAPIVQNIEPATPRELARPLDLRALEPLPPSASIARDRARALLDRDITTVLLRTLLAIAEAWDSRRIGYGDEGQHPYEHEVAALLGFNRGFATEHVAAARERLAAHEYACGDVVQVPLAELAGELGLSPLALEILLVVAAPALRSEAARLFGILANDPERAMVDEALVEQIFGEQILGARIDRHAIAAELDPRAPLVRLGVIVVEHDRPRPFAGLAVHPVILARLRREIPDLGAGVAVRGSDRALEELVLAPGVVDDALAQLARAAAPARIAVRGRPGSGRRTLLAALAAESNRALGVIDASVLPRRKGGLAPALAGALRAAQLASLLPCVVGLEDVAFDERELREAVGEVVRAHPGPLALVLPDRATALLDAGHVAIALPALGEHARLAVWRRALGDAGVAVADLEALSARYRIGAGAIYRAVSSLDRTALAGDAAPPLERFLRQLRDARVGDHAHRVERLASWDQLVLPADIVDSLHELVARARHRRTVFETWGMNRTMSTSRGLTALFSGPPGTGKTLVAGVIARELGLDLYQVDLSKLMSKWIGETERNLAAIFDAAEDGQVVLLFDEADSLFAKRTEVRSSNDRYANLEVNYLLQRLDTFEGIAILTTNAQKAIDPAFKRRMSFRLSFPFPDEETRVELWRAHLPPELPVEGDLALDRLAHKYQLSGGYIRNACLRAAFLAARDGTRLTQHHLDRAVALEFAELGKLSASGALD